MAGTGNDIMDRAAVRSVVDRSWKAICTGNWEALAEITVDDVIMEFSEATFVRGRADARAFWQYYYANYRMHVTQMNIIPQGNMAAVEATLELTYHTTKPGLPPATGQKIVMPVAVFVTLREGKIARSRFVYSLADWMRIFHEQLMQKQDEGAR
ncbi:nuclear transport factor 2 family protein [Maritimibacter sp. DP1N21-5]|uniref:nuclear transport factor 2 family protein n=1 Tax=Maritimibacter sp. DP1N21-5 TaxID=2836867 RepID=UPI001C43A085|nr:nuclear transport factor 2 family protein [Maritimibacter sp. DP1N21-5]MBV7410748.1 nuclear transport factor 2 family protein [Maritimibacter sp. DP1N21-5]